MARIYHRPTLAAEMAQQLLYPGALDEGLRSGSLISGLRRTGKTTFLVADLIPALGFARRTSNTGCRIPGFQPPRAPARRTDESAEAVATGRFV